MLGMFSRKSEDLRRGLDVIQTALDKKLKSHFFLLVQDCKEDEKEERETQELGDNG